ncbi:MAG: aminomethyl-transferring glycine dehydrogenase [Rhodospirillaceae bacterium]|nr:aminomethyl-transferring glycine dehydrogenase [Rhodospirillaceae bacterium]
MGAERRSFADLERRDDFVGRHIGPNDQEIEDMLGLLGLPSLDSLSEKAMPASIMAEKPMDLPDSRTEAETLTRIGEMAARNRVVKNMIGLGYYDTITPPVIQRNVLENPGWYTAYTPYQPEISQGRLEALLNFQTMILELTGMDLANASLLDEGTAAAEAMAFARNLSKSESNVFFVDADCLPQTIAVVETRARPIGIEVVVGDPWSDLDGQDCFGVLVQYPGASGRVRDLKPVVEAAHAKGALVTAAADLLALVLLSPPGEAGVDAVVGNSQRFGVPLGFGGPHAGYFATQDKHKRSSPGRIVGVSVDTRGRPALRLALQTREQHIRREKATSNICTAQVLLAVMASMYAVYHGPQGLETIARRTHRLAATLADGLAKLDVAVDHDAFFDTVSVRLPGGAEAARERAEKAGINVWAADGDTVLASCDETTTPAHIEALWRALSGKDDPGFSFADLEPEAEDRIPDGLWRKTAVLEHPIFNIHHSETEMLRYLRYLQDKDIALDRSMIPLGSCTMKLNATAEMIPVTWAAFGAIHPFAPIDQAAGYVELIRDLESMLEKATGWHRVTVQPNAGSQGEYAGLLVIRKYQEGRGEGQRDVCLIPSSAHGTNPASAHMAGLKVVVVGCDSNGNVDLDDLRAKAAQHADRLCALMVTYPSTHGVFEEAITEICAVVHENGGQVYMDGANLNALVGLSEPGRFGPDVMHINLHKTFCIPHGGGGPGVGPIGVAEHLAPYLPNHPLRPEAGPEDGIGPISAAPWGSAGILPISWAYIHLMGGAGLRRATQVAILNANYLAKKLEPYYPVLYKGKNGLVAHECIIDLRPIKDDCGVTVDDVAKRLMDYGFHAPTMSFPVAGTLMIEPTESEALRELDRFVEAMAAIRGEIKKVEDGEIEHEASPLHAAPHTAEDITTEDWGRAYSREEAAYPVSSLREAKYWPPVNRIDNVYGDRNLVCSCPPIEAYQNAAE